MKNKATEQEDELKIRSTLIKVPFFPTVYLLYFHSVIVDIMQMSCLTLTV